MRWFQMGAFMPLMENGGDKAHGPWEFDEPGSTFVVDTCVVVVVYTHTHTHSSFHSYCHFTSCVSCVLTRFVCGFVGVAPATQVSPVCGGTH